MVEELLLDWLYSFLTVEEQDRLTGWAPRGEPQYQDWKPLLHGRLNRFFLVIGAAKGAGSSRG